MAKKIFIAATRQNDGKTTISLGLMAMLKEKFKRIGFIKPIGQRYLVEQGYNIDEDSFLIEEIFGIKASLKDMSPIAIEKDFTQKYIKNPDKKPLEKQIINSFEKIAQDNDLVVIEGTGHAGVGSVFDLCNADVARLLEANVVVISEGGLGRPIDEILLSMPLFEKRGVKVAGVIINKVKQEKYNKINDLVRESLKQHNLDVFGVLPYLKVLDMPTMAHMQDEFKAKFISGSKENINRVISNIIVVSSNPPTFLRGAKDKNLFVLSGDRNEVIKYLLKEAKKRSRPEQFLGGFIFTCGISPDRSIKKALEKAQIPSMVAEQDTFETVVKMDEMIVKIRPEDKEKIDMIVNLAKDYIDIDKILSAV
ncbi:MAG: AAA family ATPase [Candidatus Omnitrophica bacterium]|nr:AAA family ATPase [Candidatus Omnitrophota bacterium]